MIRQQELVEKVKSYDPNADEDALNRAYVYSMKAHGAQTRESGDPYFNHPLEVAGMLTDMKLDVASIITALLHDTVEDTEATLEEIEKLFGKEIATLVDGVTKLTQIEHQSQQIRQAENFRKLVLAMSNDIRVLLIKLADRLHNMRTLDHVQSEEKRKRVARETMDIYVPLAQRIGIHHLKDELEDLAFNELNSDARLSIISRLKFLKEEGQDNVGHIIEELKQLFNDNKLKVSIVGREKTPYSIWCKMHLKNVSFEQLSDIMAFRIVVSSVNECYQALGIIHGSYPVVPGRFKDYISTPKPNHYQSIHTTVIGPRRQRIEIQIRTSSMHEISEYGVAAHWKYKQGEQIKDRHDYRWLRGLLEILENASNPEEFFENTKLEMFQDQVFCFTPKGDLISLPRGATPIDFAYAVHSEVGNHCVGAKINGRMVPLRTVLQNGDQVDVTTSKAQTPSPTWERYAITGKARACIRRFVRIQKRSQFLQLGHSMINKGFKQEALVFSEKLIEPHLKELNCSTIDDVYALIGEGLKSVHDVIRHIYPKHIAHFKHEKSLAISSAAKDSENAVSIRGLIPGMAVHYAGCCHPLRGDKIVGIVVTGRGVTIHTYDCENLKQFADQLERWLDVSWSDEATREEKQVGRLHVIVVNKIGNLAILTALIGKNMGNILNLKITHRTEEFYDFLLDIEVRDAAHLATIMAALRSSDYVNSVERVKG
jgi:guanosine-3',5'-bis(diphosphate) 3'-pyrophosphohydrolase